MKWKHVLRYWSFFRGIHRSPVNSPHKGQWRGALMFSLICAWMNAGVNICEAGDLRCHLAHYDVTIMISGENGAQHIPLCHIQSNEISSCDISGVHCIIRWYTTRSVFSKLIPVHPYNLLVASRLSLCSTLVFAVLDLILHYNGIWEYPHYWPFVRRIHKSPVTWSFDVSCDQRLNKYLLEQTI